MVEQRVTPSMQRRRVNAKRSRKQLKAKRSAEKPSWQASLRRRYIEGDKTRQGKPVDPRSWEKRQKDAKRLRELDQVRRRRGHRSEQGEEEDDEAEEDDGDDEENEEQFAFGENLEAAAEDGVEVQDDIDEDKMSRLNEKKPLDLQVFLKGLPNDVEESELTAYLDRFGKVDRIFIVRNKLTGMATGSAFVHFSAPEGCAALNEHAERNSIEAASAHRGDQRVAVDGMSKHKAKELLYKMKHQQTVSKEPFITYAETRVTVYRPMNRTDAQEFIGSLHKGGKKAKRTVTGQDDPRNLYLLREGLVEASTPAAKGLHPAHLQSLQRDYDERKAQLKNVNFFVSKTRLSVRNLPRDVDTPALRKLFVDKAKEFFKKNPTLKDKKQWGKHGPVKQARVLVDAKGQSKRFGFIEFVNHEVALYSLRMLNNNPEVYGAANRPVINFAIENYNALQKLQRIRDNRKAREDALRAAESGEGDAAPQDTSYRALAMKTRDAISNRRAAEQETGGPRRRVAPGKAGGGGGKGGGRKGQGGKGRKAGKAAPKRRR